jgi:predicted 3-demethylubiquinone-9 3-methyltransferase (glyoxalase superfamily)
MNNSIYPCMWFNGQAKEAAEFYCGIFSNSKITTDNGMVVIFEIEGKKIMGLNGGPMFSITPAISLFVTCEKEEETEGIYNKLMDGGTAMMALNKYPWSEQYAWVKDKFGMTWQLMLGQVLPGQKIITSFLFANEKYGHAKEAIDLYTSLFPNSQIHPLQFYRAGEEQAEGKLKFGHFTLSNQTFSAMDGPGDHAFSFTEGLSLVVECDTQEEIDHYWNNFTKEGQESMCGWLKDKFGVSWQIVPKVLGSLMSDPEKGGRAMQALMKMKKLDINGLVNA